MLVVKNPAANVRDAGDDGLIPGSVRFPYMRRWQTTPVFLPVKFNRQRNVAVYSPWCCKESNMTE